MFNASQRRECRDQLFQDGLVFDFTNPQQIGAGTAIHLHDDLGRY